MRCDSHSGSRCTSYLPVRVARCRSYPGGAPRVPDTGECLSRRMRRGNAGPACPIHFQLGGPSRRKCNTPVHSEHVTKQGEQEPRSRLAPPVGSDHAFRWCNILSELVCLHFRIQTSFNTTSCPSDAFPGPTNKTLNGPVQSWANFPINAKGFFLLGDDYPSRLVLPLPQ